MLHHRIMSPHPQPIDNCPVPHFLFVISKRCILISVIREWVPSKAREVSSNAGRTRRCAKRRRVRVEVVWMRVRIVARGRCRRGSEERLHKAVRAHRYGGGERPASTAPRRQRADCVYIARWRSRHCLLPSVWVHVYRGLPYLFSVTLGASLQSELPAR